MKVILFIVYYSKLRLAVIFGFHHTLYPLGLGWRWSLWKARYVGRLNDSLLRRTKSVLIKSVFRR